VNSPPRSLAYLSECEQKGFPVAVVPNNRFPAIATIEEVIHGACKFHSRFPGHERGDLALTVAASSS
jgi:hypothetical protein